MSKKENFPHILNASATLLGLCFIVLTSLRSRQFHEASIIDEFTAAAILLFMASSILSYLSMRNIDSDGRAYERFADGIFLAGLFFLFVITMLIIFDVIR